MAAYIASGMTDVGVGVQTAADRFNLNFILLMKERNFIALPIAMMEDPLIELVIKVVQSNDFHHALDELAGYDFTDTGKILLVSKAFDLGKASN